MQLKKKQLFAILIFTLLFLILSIPGFFKYIIIAFFSVLLVISTRKNIKKNYLIILCPSISYAVLGLLSSMINGFFNIYSLKQLIFLLLPALASIGVYTYYEQKNIDIVKIIFVATILCTLRLIPSFNSVDLLESTYCFIYGIFSIYFFYDRDYKRCVFSLTMMILSHKRIVYLAAILCLFLLFILRRNVRQKVKKRICTFVSYLSIIISYIFVWLLDNGWIIIFFHKKGINSMGREYIWSHFSTDYVFNVSFLGKGVGYILNKIDYLNLGQYSGNLHSDLLASFIELGFFGFGLWLLSYIIMNRKIEKMYLNDNDLCVVLMAFFIFLIINYFTDNILIYIEFWFSFNLILLKIISTRRKYDTK